MKKMIGKQKILANPFLNRIFEEEKYKPLLPSFIANVEAGSKIEKNIIIHDLIELAFRQCGSLVYRTICWYFAMAVYITTPLYDGDSLLNIGEHWDKFDLSMTEEESDKYNVTIMETDEYLVEGMDIMESDTKAKTPQFAYAMYLFFQQEIESLSNWDDPTEELKEVLAAIEERIKK